MDSSRSPALHIGRPHVDHENYNKTKIATFTRFVLPFAYKLENRSPGQNTPPALHYTVNPLSDLSFLKRKKYFTRETGRILYEQALWLDMCNSWNDTPWGKGEVEINLRGRAFKVGMLPPRITLFEAAGGQDRDIPARLAAQQEADIRHTGFLQVDLYFPEGQDNTPELDDLLLFNEMFRYYDMPYDAHLSIFRGSLDDMPVSYIKPKTVKHLAEEGVAPQSCYFERWANLLTEIPLVHNNRRYRLFPKKWAEDGMEWSCGSERKSTSRHWQVYDENQAYVWTAAFLDKGGCTLQECFASDEDKGKALQASEYGHWIKLLNVDAPEFNFAEKKHYPPAHTHQSFTEFEQNWAEQRTYKRWEENGTWYGFCDHGGAVLAPPLPFIFGPVQSYYFDLIMLLHFTRLTIRRFSLKLSNILIEKDNWDTCEQSRQKLAHLRKRFTQFTVSYRYPMIFNQYVSNQQQLLELYDLYKNQQKPFDIERFFKEVQVEIDNTHEFLELLESTRLANAANNLSTYGIPLAVAAVLAALFAVPDLQLIDACMAKGEYVLDWDRIWEWGVVLLASVGTWCCLKRKAEQKKGVKK
jgi:hypothetical protein